MCVHEWRERRNKQIAYFQLKIKISVPKYTRTIWSPCSLNLANEHLPMHTRNILYAILNHNGSVFQFVWFYRYFKLNDKIKNKGNVFYKVTFNILQFFQHTSSKPHYLPTYTYNSQIYMLIKRATLYNNNFDWTPHSTQRT